MISVAMWTTNTVLLIIHPLIELACCLEFIERKNDQPPALLAGYVANRRVSTSHIDAVSAFKLEVYRRDLKSRTRRR